MKFFVPLLALGTLSLTACSTDANRRALYSPKEADGYWTRMLEDGTYENRRLADADLPGDRAQDSEPEKPRRFRHFRRD